MKKPIVYITLLLSCFLFSNRSQAIVANISFTPIFVSELSKFDANIEVNAPFQFVISDDKEEQEDLFCDDEFDDTDDDDFHQKATKESAIIDNKSAFFSTKTTLVTFSYKQQIKLFILLCSLKLHC